MTGLARVIALVLTACCAPPTLLGQDGAATFSGRFETTFGPMELTVIDGAVTGTYVHAVVGTITGRVAGTRLEFRYEEPEEQGQGWFELAADGQSFRGQWRADDGRGWSEWTGRRGEEPLSFAGLWSTTYGLLRLVQTEDLVEGVYSTPQGASLRGTVSDGRLAFTYVEPGVGGEGWFELAADGAALQGEWREVGSPVRRPWTGQRVRAELGKQWLVVLEAHWEGRLAEEEYSFGAMLRSYFTMALARHVEVRHRYFHDEVDLRRFAAEAAFLPGPVVLVVSTHGDVDGAQVGPARIGPAAFGDALRHAGNVRVLHLSGCLMMDGALPEQIHARLPVGVRFPISGYSTEVAWDASALADFQYLSLLLIHRFAPEDSVRQTRLLAPYTGDQAVAGTAVEPLGLEILSFTRAATSLERPDHP